MRLSNWVRPGLVVFLALALAACENYTQVTSGKEYLSKYDQSSLTSADTSGGARVDAQVRAAADVEPILRFPARIGIARLRDGQLAPTGPGEGEAWADLVRRLGPGWGEFVPISPLIAALANEPERAAQAGSDHAFAMPDYRQTLRQTVREVRLGAARQHVDAVLVYEAFATSEVTSNLIAVTKLALIGFFLPSEDVEAKGFAQAVLLDVRNGYTYGMATAKGNKAEFALATSANQGAVANRMNRQAEVAAVQALTPEVETMLRDLRLKLAEKRAAEAETQ